MRRSLNLLGATALAALCGVALDAASNPLFADGATCASGSSNICMVQEYCTDYGWSYSFQTLSIGQTCLAKTIKSFYWTSSGGGTSGAPKSYVPAS